MILWDIETGEPIRYFIGNFPPNMWYAALSPDGETALSGSGSSLTLWDVNTGQQIRRFFGAKGEEWAHGSSIVSVTYSEDGTKALDTSLDNTLILWDVTSGHMIRRLTGHDSFVVHGKMTRDVARAVSTSEDLTMILWDLENGDILRRYYDFKSPLTHIEISADGKFALIGGPDNSVLQWKLWVPTLDELISWIKENRIVQPFTSEERVLYHLDPLITDNNDKNNDKNNQIDNETAEGKNAISIPTLCHRFIAKSGKNRGKLKMGEYAIWSYSGKRGEILDIWLEADNPATHLTYSEQIKQKAMDMYVILIAPDGSLLVANDNEATTPVTTNSFLEKVELPVTGIYQIQARTYNDLNEGKYTLTIESNIR